LFKQMTNAPTHTVALTHPYTAIALAMGPGQGIGNGATQARFFSDIEFHWYGRPQCNLTVFIYSYDKDIKGSLLELYCGGARLAPIFISI